MKQLSLSLLTAGSLFLAACSGEPETTAEGEGEDAKGEILGGSISDDMLPLESVTSQSPSLANAPPADGEAAPPEEESEASEETEAEPQSAPSPEPEQEE